MKSAKNELRMHHLHPISKNPDPHLLEGYPLSHPPHAALHANYVNPPSGPSGSATEQRHELGISSKTIMNVFTLW